LLKEGPPSYRAWSHAQIFFARPKTFDFFIRNQKFKRRAREIVSAKQGPPPPLASAFVDLFSGRPKLHLGKLSRNSVGGGANGSFQ
jgi:hypothetical protein